MVQLSTVVLTDLRILNLGSFKTGDKVLERVSDLESLARQSPGVCLHFIENFGRRAVLRSWRQLARDVLDFAERYDKE